MSAGGATSKGRALAFGWPVRLFVLIVFAIFAVTFIAETVGARPGERWIGAAIIAAVAALVALPSWFVLRPHWYVDERGIERRIPLRKRAFLAWHDVTSVASSGPGFSVHGHAGARFVLAGGLGGLDVFSYLVLTHVPADRIPGDAVRRRLAHRARRFRPVPAYALAPEVHDAAVDPRARWRENPFFVLGLSPECSRVDVERTGQKLLGLLAIGSAAARTYPTPVGPGERTEDGVRAAVAELRDPDRRIGHEIWARAAAAAVPADPRADAAAPWAEAMAALGWRRS